MNELGALPFDMAEQVLAELALAKAKPQALVEGFPERKARGYELVGGQLLHLISLEIQMDSIRHTAWAVMPFSSPSKPMPSEVVAFTLTCDTSTPMCRARWTRIWSI